MPFVNRAITPVYLSQKRVSDDRKVGNEFEAVSNNTLVETIKQLACLVRYADDIFTRIYDKCNVIHSRSTVVKNKLTNVIQIVENLDAKSVQVPVGDIDSFIRTKKHYKTRYNKAEHLSRNLFLIDSRPEFIQNVYEQAVERPLQVIRSIEKYREDELVVCKFSSNLHNRNNKSHSEPDLEIETRKPATLLIKLTDEENRYENDEDLSSSETLIASSKILPSPEELTKAAAEEYPAEMVPIDVTGSGFQRMSNFRRSLLQITFLEKRKKRKKAKRRNTICEGENSNTLKKEVQDALTQTDNISNKSVKRRSLGIFNLRRKSADMLDSSDSVFLSETLKSKKTSTSTSCQTEEILSDGNKSKGSLKKISTCSDKENVSGPNRFIRGLFRSTKSKSLKNSTSSINNEPVPSKSVPSKKGSSVIPISTLSQAMSVAVKMRDSSVRVGKNAPKDEERNSSSGNWSASSSTCTSFNSDCTNKNMGDIPSSGMTSSRSSRDSAVSEKENQDGGNCSQEETITGASGYTSDSTIAGTMSTCSFAYQPKDCKFTESRTDMWLHHHSKPILNSSLDDHASDGDASTPLALSPFTTRRTKNSNAVTDDESSVYSVDADGYYTSMHTDSGLRGGLLPSPPPLPALASSKEKDLSNTLNPSDIEFSNSDTICIRKKPTPPRPPVRTSSNMNGKCPTGKLIYNSLHKSETSNKKFSQDNNENSRSNSISSTCSSSATNSSASNSESDPEAANQLQHKTTINTQAYPSMVHVSESEDDYDVKATLSSSNYWQKAGYIGNDRIYANPNVLKSPATSKRTMNCQNSSFSAENSLKPESEKDLDKRSPEPVDLKSITYPVVQTVKVNCTPNNLNISVSRHNLKRPSTLNIKGVKISEHDVPMLQNRYNSISPALYSESLLKQKSSLQRSKSMKQEQTSPLSPKSQLISSKMTCNPEASYGSNSLGRKRNKHHMMNVESVVAAQLPLSKKYSTLPTKLKYNSNLDGDDRSASPFNKKMYNSLSLDRRNLRTPRGSRRANSPVVESYSKIVRSPKNSSTPKQNGTVSEKKIMQPYRDSEITNSSIKSEPQVNLSVHKSQLDHSASSTNSGISSSGSSANNSQKPSPQCQNAQSKSKKSTMSSQDLYIAIHNSKKKLNIKTEPFVSPISSRSTSPNVGRFSNSSSRASTPGCTSPTPSIQSNVSNGSIPRKAGTVLAETGFLSPRGGSLRNSPGERKSWAAGSHRSPSPMNVQSDKPSLAFDRLRSRKPTSITDFKKLLLQTKTSSGHQRSAAEMLRATSPVRERTSSPSNASYFQPISPVSISSSTRGHDPHISTVSKSSNARPINGHIVNSFKRGGRLRSSLPVGGIITSPIWEDNGEGENAAALSSRASRASISPLANGKTYGYLTQGQATLPPLANAGPILHIPTRSALESSV